MNSYYQAVKNVMNHGERFKRLDLRAESDFKCVMELFGGEKNVKEMFPFLYQRALAASNSLRSDCLGENDTGVNDRVLLCDLSMKNNRAYSYGFGTLTKAATQIYTIITIFKNEEMIGRNFGFWNGTNECIIDSTADISGANADDKIKAVIQMTYTLEGSNLLESVIADSEELEIVDDPISSLTVAHPSTTNYVKLDPILMPDQKEGDVIVRDSKEGSKQLTYVNVCYDRAPENGESINYAFGSTRIGKTQQQIYLDLRGSFKLADDCTFKKFNSFNGGITMARGGMASYRSLVNESYFSINEAANEVSFAFPTDWSTKIPSTSLAGRELSCIDFQIKFTFNDKRDKTKPEGEDRNWMITASSITPTIPSETSTSFVQLPKVKLNWGCVEESMLVTMADGTQKPIKELSVGERLKTGTEKDAAVTKIIRGQEDELIVLRARGGENLKVSAFHPILTDSGMKCALDVSPADKLVDENENLLDIDAIYEIQGDFTVYNVELENEDSFICAGYFVGDNEMQADVMNPVQKAERVPQEYVDEAKKVAGYFLNMAEKLD